MMTREQVIRLLRLEANEFDIFAYESGDFITEGRYLNLAELLRTAAKIIEKSLEALP